MRVSIAAVLGVTASMLVCAPSAEAAPAAATAAVADTVSALYEMNESAGTVMTDSSGNGNHGVINPAGVQRGMVFDNATGYYWTKRPPTAPPAHPERVITVADDPALEPGDQDFTLEIRYRTSNPYGNIIQKGQALAVGGQWKVQLPGGSPSCLFQGIPDAGSTDPNDNQIATSTTRVINDNQWHTLRCEFSFIETPTGPSSRVDLFIDGAYQSRKNGYTGPIDNNAPMTVGGKLNCDQVAITCDYFDGQIDYVKLSKSIPPPPANDPPDAVMPVPTCTLYTCSFSSTGSIDSDGSIASYAWTFGDNTTSTLPNPSHVYTAAGTYQVRLVVTDNGGATGSATRQVTVPVGLPPNIAPDAVMQVPTCTLLVCAFSSAGSTDPDGSIVSYAWTFGDNTTSSLANPSHTFALSGTYTVKLVVTDNRAGTDSATRTQTVVEALAPSKPREPVATAGDRSAVVSWKAPSEPGRSAVTGYRVTSLPAGGTCMTTALTCTVTGLTNEISYTFTLVATSAAGDSPPSIATNSVTPIGKPLAPTTVIAERGNGQATVRWAGASGNGVDVTSYVITMSTGPVKVMPATSASVVWSGLHNGSAYRFSVSAVSVHGASTARWSGFATPAGRPGRPGHVVAKKRLKGAVVRWRAPAYSGERVLRYTIVASNGKRIVASSAQRHVRFHHLKSGRKYSFKVIAANSLGRGAWSTWSRKIRAR